MTIHQDQQDTVSPTVLGRRRFRIRTPPYQRRLRRYRSSSRRARHRADSVSDKPKTSSWTGQQQPGAGGVSWANIVRHATERQKDNGTTAREEKKNNIVHEDLTNKQLFSATVAFARTRLSTGHRCLTCNRRMDSAQAANDYCPKCIRNAPPLRVTETGDMVNSIGLTRPGCRYCARPLWPGGCLYAKCPSLLHLLT